MRLLLDENAGSKRLRLALEAAGFNVETVSLALGAGSSDAKVAAYAKDTGRVLVTLDQDDFRRLYDCDSDHPGLIVVYSPLFDFNAASALTAFENIARLYPVPTGLVLSLQEFFW